MRTKLSNEYLNLKYAYCRKKLESLPKVSKGIHCGRPVFRLKLITKDGCVKYTEIRPESKKALSLNEIEFVRQKLCEELKTLENTKGLDLKISLKYRASRNNPMNGAFFKSLVSESNEQPFSNNYYHKGIHMRSRAELIVAEVLDELRLQYKYEPAMEINGVVYFPDFIVYIEAIDSCFAIEVLGMADNIEYMMNNSGKLAKYAGAGLIINGNLLLIAGTASYVPDTDEVYNCVVDMVNHAVWNALV